MAWQNIRSRPTSPPGIVAADQNAWFIGTYIPWAQWFLMDKYRIFTGIVRNFTIGPDPKRLGTQAIYVHPCPQVAGPYDIAIKAWRRPMNLSGRDAWQQQGTIAVTAGSAAVTGSGTAFDQRMVGSVFRAAIAGAQPPTGTNGANPFWFQQTIQSVTDATHLTLTAAAPTTFTGAGSASGIGYCVSDPCDIPQSLFEAFKEGINAQTARLCNPKEREKQVARYQQAACARRKGWITSTEPRRAWGREAAPYRDYVTIPTVQPLAPVFSGGVELSGRKL